MTITSEMFCISWLPYSRKASEWVGQFLKDRRRRVIIKGTKSDCGNVTSGIPQGSILGPILFVLFIHDIPDDILSSIVMFADDTKLWSKVNNTEVSLQFWDIHIS